MYGGKDKIEKFSEEDKEKAEKIVAQGLAALEIFERTGDRRPFVAFMDQVVTFDKERKINATN